MFTCGWRVRDFDSDLRGGGEVRSLDLFTGYGGITLALHEWCRPIAYVEIEEYAQRIIAERMADGSLPRAPILADVQNIGGKPGDCDIIVGGFPCQDISCAGTKKGLVGKRSGLFFEIARLTKEICPSFVFLENVHAIRTKGLQTVIEEFSALGYDCRWTVISASAVGAPHKRERWFMLAHSTRERCTQGGEERDVCKEDRRPGSALLSELSRPSGWEAEPNVGRMANGTPFRVDRIKALGNGVVPEQARRAFRYLMGDLI